MGLALQYIYGDQFPDVNKTENEILRLMMDDDVSNKKGIYTYLFTKKEKELMCEFRISRKIRRLFENNDENEGLRIILHDDEIAYYKKQAQDTGILLKHGESAKASLRRHYMALGIRPPKECY